MTRHGSTLGSPGKTRGEPFGRALAQRILNPEAASAGPFVTWFKILYGL